MTHPLTCRLCAFNGLAVALELQGMPRWNHRLLRQNEVHDDRGIDITIQTCPSCGFVCLPLSLSEAYYDDYVNVPSLSAHAQQFQQQQARQFVQRFGLQGAHVLEVGCGDGYFLSALQEHGARASGIEPSLRQSEIARARGLDVEIGILDKQRVLAKAPFDAFVTRQVFEHVEDMRDFLLSIRANLRLGAHGLVEVPNLDKLTAEARFFDFIPEHINYFTPQTLRLALQLAGFDVLEVAPVQDGEALHALVQWNGSPQYTPLRARVDSLRAEIQAFVRDCRAKGQRVAAWGAGGKGLSMLAAVELDGLHLLVDSDPGKVGLYTPVSHICVAPPEQIAAQAIDAVIVMAPAYEREIARDLRSRYNFAGTIVLAGSGFQVLDPST